MIYEKRGDPDTVLLVDHAFSDVIGLNRDSGIGKAFQYVTPQTDIFRKGLFEIRHHRLGAFGTPYLKRSGSASHDPAGQPDVRNADKMVRVHMRDEQLVYVLKRHAELSQSNGRTASTVK